MPERIQTYARDMTTMTSATAGQRLRADLDTALADASRALGRRLEWTEIESHTIDSAVLAADRAEQLRALLEAELAAVRTRPGLVVKLSAEARLCERQAVDLVATVNVGVGQRQSLRGHSDPHIPWHPSLGFA